MSHRLVATHRSSVHRNAVPSTHLQQPQSCKPNQIMRIIENKNAYNSTGTLPQAHLEPLFLVYAWYMSGIYHTYCVLIHMYDMCMVYIWYIFGYTMYIHHSGYTMYIQGYTWYIHKVYTWYIYGTSMVYHLTYIHGISLDILGYSRIFLSLWIQISRPACADAAGLIQCAHVCGWSTVFYCMRHPGNCTRVKGLCILFFPRKWYGISIKYNKFP